MAGISRAERVSDGRGRGFLRLLSLGLAAAGCTAPAGPGRSEDRLTTEVRAINQDPVAYLRRLRERCDELEQYTLTFSRQERLGLIPTLGAVETVRATFRKEPFSVRFEWPDENTPYRESVYVAGRNEGKLLLAERRGVLFAPPQVRAVDVDLPVRLGMAKNPITAFGLAHLVRRTVVPFEDASLEGRMTIRCEGVAALEPGGRPAYHLRIERPPTPGYRYTRQDVYVDVATGLPAGTDLWLASGELDARYRYTDVDLQVRPADADFAIRPAASRPSAPRRAPARRGE